MSSAAPPRDLLRPQHRRARIVLVGLAVLFCLALLALPTGAFAGEVHFDPNSPAGKEYALPLTQARDESGAGSKGDHGGNAATPEEVSLFGIGVAPAGSGSPDRPAGGSGGGVGEPGTAASGTEPGGRGGKPGSSGGAAPDPAVVEEQAGYSFGGGLLWVALLSAAGIAAGLGIRASRRGGSRPPA